MVLIAFVAGIVCTEASAQTPATSHRPEVDLGLVWAGGGSLGSTDANLSTPTGSSQPLFSTNNELGASAGVEAHLAFRLTGRLGAEVSASWLRADLRSRVTADFEGADPVTSTLATSRVVLEGSGLWYFARRGRIEPFVRGGAGWFRELTSDNVLSSDGVVANAGAGMKYWWRERGRGFLRRLGLRSELRLVMRSGGLSLGTKRRVVAPAATVSAIIGL